MGTASVPPSYFGLLIPQTGQAALRPAFMSPRIALQRNMPDVAHDKTLQCTKGPAAFSRPLFLESTTRKGTKGQPFRICPISSCDVLEDNRFLRSRLLECLQEILSEVFGAIRLRAVR
jgi:hypothetical protein